MNFSFFILVFSIVLDIWIFKKISNIEKINFFIWIAIGILIFISTILFQTSIPIINIFELLIFIVLFKKKLPINLLLGSVFSFCTLDLLIDIGVSIFISIFRLTNSVFIDALLRIGLIISTFYIVSKIAKKIHSQLIGKNKNVFLGLLVYLYISSEVITILFIKSKVITPVVLFFTVFIIVQSIFIIGTYYELISIQKHLLKKFQQDKLIKEQKQLQDYAEYLEKSEDELRAFRHDYRNMFNSLKISAQEGDTKELIQKLDEYTKTNLNAKAFEKYRDVNHIKIKSLKSIIIAKLTEMYGSDIPYNFECRDDITKIPNNINELDLVRIIGISCDNAIEESKALLKQKKKAHIEIMISSNEDDEFEYEIQNKRRDSEISLKQIQQRGYSTKKSHSGMGLANINSIKNKYENMTISYEVPKGYFDFYLVIEPEELINS